VSDAADRSAQVQRLVANIERVISGKAAVVEASVVCLLADGNLLVEGVPGVGKTMLARSLARSIDGDFRRVQATPDLLPSDVTGISVYDQDRREFRFVPGPLFANVVLVDEINRATPRTQSALLEPMEERQVTVEGVAHELPSPFFLVATENPAEHHGIYPLPEGQLDRFTIALHISYPEGDEARQVVSRQILRHPIEDLEPVLSAQDVVALQDAVRAIHVAPAVIEYAVSLVEATRTHRDVALGASPRASVALTHCAQARALVRGRDYALPDDVKSLAPAVLSHRLILQTQASGGAAQRARGVIDELLEQVPVPLGVDEPV
jgi:MoxR-like ATPase